MMNHPYSSFLHEVAKPARYAGGEAGQVRKDWSAVEARVCLAFPDLYDIGMSHLGFKILYKILNDDPRILAERAYTPWTDMQAELIDAFCIGDGEERTTEMTLTWVELREKGVPRAERLQALAKLRGVYVPS